MTNRENWVKCAAFHGHECPGLAIGYRAAEVALDFYHLTTEEARQTGFSCLCTKRFCGVDAVQVLLGCTIGNKKLELENTEEITFRFSNPNDKPSLQVKFIADIERMEKPEKQLFILEAPTESLFTLSSSLPKRSSGEERL